MITSHHATRAVIHFLLCYISLYVHSMLLFIANVILFHDESKSIPQMKLFVLSTANHLMIYYESDCYTTVVMYVAMVTGVAMAYCLGACWCFCGLHSFPILCCK